jgi:hypothetical protein
VTGTVRRDGSGRADWTGPGLAAEAKNNQPLIRPFQLTLFGLGVHVTMWRIVYCQRCTADEQLFWPYKLHELFLSPCNIDRYVVANKT